MKKTKLLKLIERPEFFLILALVMLLITIFLVVKGFSFTLSSLDKAFNKTISTIPPTKFDIEGFKDLNLIKEK